MPAPRASARSTGRSSPGSPPPCAASAPSSASRVAVVAAHVVDDTLVQPPSGTPATDHLVSAAVPVALLALLAWAYPRLSGFARGTLALALGPIAIVAGVEAAYYTHAVGPSGDDFTGLLALAAGVVLLGLGAVTLWRTRRTDGTLLWRYPRRALLAVAARASRCSSGLPLASRTSRRTPAAPSCPADRARRRLRERELHDERRPAARGLVRAVAQRRRRDLVPRPQGPQRQARMLARHGYGVLLFDRRGEGRSEGEPNAWGWSGDATSRPRSPTCSTAATSTPRASAASACRSAAR